MIKKRAARTIVSYEFLQDFLDISDDIKNVQENGDNVIIMLNSSSVPFVTTLENMARLMKFPDGTTLKVDIESELEEYWTDNILHLVVFNDYFPLVNYKCDETNLLPIVMPTYRDVENVSSFLEWGELS